MIVKLFKSRNPGRNRFITLLRPHVDLLYRMAYRWTQSATDAEDLVQDILLRLSSRVAEMEQVESLRPWLIRVLYRRYVDLYRHRQRIPEEPQEQWQSDIALLRDHIAEAVDDADQIARLELQELLLKAMETLDDDQRDALLLHDVEGYTALETAEILDISVGTVKSRVSRARNKLKNFLHPGTF